MISDMEPRVVTEPADQTPNALTRQVFEDTDAGRNLNRYQTVDELFEHINASEDTSNRTGC
jgi:hypothetical protein